MHLKFASTNLLLINFHKLLNKYLAQNIASNPLTLEEVTVWADKNIISDLLTYKWSSYFPRNEMYAHNKEPISEIVV